MRKLLPVLAIALTLSISILSQTPPSNWTVGTITSVTQVSGSPGEAEQYDIAIRVGDTIYVVRYVQEPGTTLVQYKQGLETTVLVGEKTIKANDIRGVVREAPIISKKPVTSNDTEHP